MNTTNNTTIRNAWINWVNTGLVRTAYNKKTERTFKSISSPYANSQNGFIVISVSNNQTFASKHRNGMENQSYVDVLLGKPDKLRKVSICTKAPVKDVCQGEYKDVYITNAEIAESFNASRKAYKTAKAFAQETVA